MAEGDVLSNQTKSSQTKPKALISIDPFYQQALSTYPAVLKSSKAKGRHAAASHDLNEGVTVWQEQATAYVVRSEYLDQQCHVCLDTLTTKLMCSDCNKAYYCSHACLEKDDTHSIICSTLSQVDAVGRATDVEPDLLRLILHLLARRQRDEETDRKRDPGSELLPTPFWCVNDLISHRDRADPAFIHVVTQAAQRILSELPEAAQIPVDDVVTLACRINANAHGLGDNEARNTDVALGLFPIGAMFFNHACNPNCVFVGIPGGQLAFRTIRPVKQNEELTVSYIDVYASRDERRQDLLQTKNFWCKCKRCTHPMNASVDRFLQSVVCTECRQDVYVIPPLGLQEIANRKKIVDTDILQESEWKCARCGHTARAQFVAEVLKRANSLYEEGMRAIYRERNYRQARAKLEQLARMPSTDKELPGGDLHPQNALRLNASIPLMNCLRHEQDLLGAINVNRTILKLLQENAKYNLPGNTSEISDFWQNLGELYTAMAKQCAATNRGPLERRYKKDARDAFANAAKVRSIVFGPSHPKTRNVQQIIGSLCG